MKLRGWALLGTILAVASAARAEEGGEASLPWHRLVAIVQYLQSDFPAAVASGSPAEMEEQQAMAAEALVTLEEIGPAGARFRPRLVQLRDLVAGKRDSTGVARLSSELVEELVAAGGLVRSPRHVPDLAQGQALYQTNCAACHGIDGRAQTPIAATQQPTPANFHDPERMGRLSPYRAFNALTFGVSGTAMPSFSTLGEQQRWELAFYLFTLRQPACTGRPSQVPLSALATLTDSELAAQYGDDAVHCLRRRLPERDLEQALRRTRLGIEEAINLVSAGRPAAAKRALLDAYLQGIEPIEPVLRMRDPQRVQELEERFTRARYWAESGDPRFFAGAQGLLDLLNQLDQSHRGMATVASVFWMALAILLREGFEAAVVIAALLAVLKKLAIPERARWVHAGWISAIGVGAICFFSFRTLLAGVGRELFEGMFSLVAVAMLVYAALWLNARVNISRWMGELRGQMMEASSRGSPMGFFAIAFVAMLRESLETAVFLEGLALDSRSGALWGAGAGLAILLALVLFVRRVGFRLPMKALFRASTVLMMVTAVVLLGKGLHALQEAGSIPLAPTHMFRIDALGIYPDWYSLLPQLLLALAPLAWLKLRGPFGGGRTAQPVTRAKAP